MPSTAAEVSPNNLELRKLSVHASPPDVGHFMNSRNLIASPTHVSNHDATPSTSTQQPSASSAGSERERSPFNELQSKSLPISPFYNLNTELDDGPPTGKVRRLSPKTVAEISRADRHTILFSAMVAPSRSRVSSPVRKLLNDRDPCTSCFQSTSANNKNGQSTIAGL